MALNKDITLANGVVVTYHRVVGITTIVNCSTTIEVAAYATAAKRAEEAAAIAGAKSMDVYIGTSYAQLAYREALSVPDAYAHLKTLPEYAGATDC